MTMKLMAEVSRGEVNAPVNCRSTEMLQKVQWPGGEASASADLNLHINIDAALPSRLHSIDGWWKKYKNRIESASEVENCF